ncbi:MAG: MFS transporter, partial [Actinobacteria bacterium]|nr:MFS transporter [Actinomycetota bacterium]
GDQVLAQFAHVVARREEILALVPGGVLHEIITARLDWMADRVREHRLPTALSAGVSHPPLPAYPDGLVRPGLRDQQPPASPPAGQRLLVRHTRLAQLAAAGAPVSIHPHRGGPRDDGWWEIALPDESQAGGPARESHQDATRAQRRAIVAWLDPSKAAAVLPRGRLARLAGVTEDELAGCHGVCLIDELPRRINEAGGPHDVRAYAHQGWIYLDAHTYAALGTEALRELLVHEITHIQHPWWPERLVALSAPLPDLSNVAAASRRPVERGQGVRGREFRLFRAGQTVSMIGSQVTNILLPILAFTQLHTSAAWAGGLVVASFATGLLVKLPAGRVVDRFGKRPLLVGADLGQLALMATIPAFGALGWLTLTQLYLVTVLRSALSSVFDIAAQTSRTSLLGSEDDRVLTEANARLASSASFARIVGPLLGMAVAGVIGVSNTVLLDAASFGVSALAIALIRLSEPATRRQATGGRAKFTEGLAEIRRDRIVRAITAAQAWRTLFGTILNSTLTVFLISTLHASNGAIGLVYALDAAAATLGAKRAVWVGERMGSARLLWLLPLLAGSLFFLVPLAQPGWGLALVAVGLAANNTNNVIWNSSALVSLQKVPQDVRSRVIAANNWLNDGGGTIGTLLGVALLSGWGARAPLLVNAIGMLVFPLLPVLFSPLRGARTIEEAYAA